MLRWATDSVRWRIYTVQTSNTMRIDNEWISYADRALKDSGIVVDNKYPEEFKGYISSFSATIVQMGIYPAMIVFENTESDTSSERYRLPLAVLYLLCMMKKVQNKYNLNAEYCLSDQYAASKNKELLAEYIKKAIVALKVAIRMYSGEKDLKLKCCDADLKSLPEKNVLEHTCVNRGNVNKQSNIGWLFYRDYYSGYSKNTEIQEKVFEDKKNPYIFGSVLDSMLTENISLKNILLKSGFEAMTFRTMNPGLVIGLGLAHGTSVKNDLKTGFQFDYTTGLPYIPGSSIKGVLRSMFPFENDDKEDVKAYYIISILKDLHKGVDFNKHDVEELAKDIFMHDEKETYDVFMDAVITAGRGKFLSDDYLASQHEKPYGDPVPIQFMKVLPNVEFTFFFKLTDTECRGVVINKKELFRAILEDIGVGAKTNVGYGQLEFIC